MTSLYASGYLIDNARTEGETKTAFEQLRDVVEELLGGAAETQIEISSGTLSPSLGVHTIETEASAATDTLDNIDTSNHPDGRFLLLRLIIAARTITVTNNAGGAGQIYTQDGNDFDMDHTKSWILLKRVGTVWYEIMRSQEDSFDLWYDGSALAHTHKWNQTPVEAPTGTDGTDGLAQFTLPGGDSYTTGTLRVLVNDVEQDGGGTDFSEDGGGNTTFTFTSGSMPLSGDKIRLHWEE